MTFINTAAHDDGPEKQSCSKLLLCAVHFVLAVTNGWALKHHSDGRRQYSLAAYGLFLVHSVFSLLRYTHPSAAGKLQRSISDLCALYVPLLFSTLIVTQVLLILNDFSLLWLVGSILIYIFSLTIALFTSFDSNVNRRQRYAASKFTASKWHSWSMDACVLWHIAFLVRIAYTYEECYWIAGLSMLIFLNHFVLWRLNMQYSISQLEITAVGLCFTVFFAINAEDEILELASSGGALAYAHGR